MTRRKRHGCAGAALLFLLSMSCQPSRGAQQPDGASATPQFDDPPARGKQVIAIVTPARAAARDLWSALVQELSVDYDISTTTVDAATTPEQLDAKLGKAAPVCVVVMDNRTLGLYRRLQQRQPSRAFPPAVILMTSYLQEVIGGVRTATGISYEVPLMSSFVAMREISPVEVKRVGVVHRKLFRKIVAVQAELAATEELTIVPRAIDDAPTVDDLADALSVLIDDEHVDALWVLNDNSLLTREMLLESWLPALEERPLPVVVGVSALVRPDVPFGTLAVLPDHEAMAVQAANIIFDLADNDWHLVGGSVEKPLSMRTVVNVPRVEEYFGLKPGARQKIDEIVQ